MDFTNMSDINKKMLLAQYLLNAATILTELNDIDNKNKLLDIAQEYVENAEKEYLASLDQEVLSIIDEVKHDMTEGLI